MVHMRTRSKVYTFNISILSTKKLGHKYAKWATIFITIIHAIDTTRCGDRSQILSQHVEWKFDPGDTTQDGHDKRDGWVYVAACNTITILCILGSLFGQRYDI